MRTRTDVLNFLAAKGCKSYLEIGVQNGDNFKKVKCNTKLGVDPNCDMGDVLKIKSNKFFASNKKKFDLIFVDGDHSYAQAKQDILNALKIVKKYIVCHDVLPMDEEHTNEYLNGGVYRAVAEVVASGKVNITTFSGDHGCGILTKADKPEIICPITDYDTFVENKWIYNVKDSLE